LCILGKGSNLRTDQCCCSVLSCVRLCDLMSCSSPDSVSISWSLLKLISIGSMMHPNISFSVTPFSSCLQSLPASGSFPLSSPFPSGGQSIRASKSFPPVNIQGSFPLGLACLLSPPSKGVSRVFYSTTV